MKLLLSRLPLLTLVLLAACSRQGSERDRHDTGPVPVEAATVIAETVPFELAAIGSVEPIATVQLKSKVQGEILSVGFADGSMVKAGDVLFRIDPRPFEAALKRAEANLSTAKTEASNATEQASRYTTLINRGAASREQFAQYLTTAEAQKAAVDARQADLDEAKLSLDWSQVQAPISGRMGAALLKQGNIVQANTDVLAVINQIKPIYVSFALPESSLSEVRRRMEGQEISVTARNAATGELLGSGILTFLDNSVDRTSAMINAKATFPNDAETLWPGQFVDVTLRLGEEPGAIVIPSTAVIEGQQGSHVFLIENGTAHLRRITVSRNTGSLAVVSEGLQAGDVVISSGQLRVADGAKVTVKPAPQAAR